MSKPIVYTLDLNFIGHAETVAAFLIIADGEIGLVETGPYSTFPVLKMAIEKRGYCLEDIKKVFLTHIHFDHAGAAWALAEMGATIYVHPLGEKHLIDPTKLYNSAKQIYQDQMDILWGKMQGIAPERIHATQDGESIPFGKSIFQAWHTPGHAVHHIAWQFDGELFAGDVAGCKINKGIVVPPCPPPDIDIESWIASLNLLKKLNIKTIHLTHFGQVRTIEKHLDQLERRLIRWSNWIRPHYEKGETVAEVTPQYQAFVRKELARYGIVGAHYNQYESANPSWMSIAGLMRYWHKKLTR